MRFHRNPNFKAELEADPRNREAIRDGATDAQRHVAMLARAAGGWMPRKGHARIEVQFDADGVYVVNTDFGGVPMEFGTVRTPPYAPLRRGVLAAGYRLDGTLT